MVSGKVRPPKTQRAPRTNAEIQCDPVCSTIHVLHGPYFALLQHQELHVILSWVDMRVTYQWHGGINQSERRRAWIWKSDFPPAFLGYTNQMLLILFFPHSDFPLSRRPLGPFWISRLPTHTTHGTDIRIMRWIKELSFGGTFVRLLCQKIHRNVFPT